MGFAEGCVKFFVAGANFTFALAGLALITVGVIYKLQLDDYTNAIPENYKNLGLASTLTIAIGSVIFLISFFGCCGAIRESTCLLTTYAVVLLVIFLAQIAIGVFAFVYIKDREAFENEIERSLNRMYTGYENNEAYKNTIDFMQQELKCCGPEGPVSSTTPAWLKTCTDKDSNKLFTDGCVNVFISFLEKVVKVIGLTVLLISATEVVGAIFSLCLANSIKNRERRFRY